MSDDAGPAISHFLRDEKQFPAAAPGRDDAPSASGICIQIARSLHTKAAIVTYLVVGLALKTYAPWHENVSADDIGTAKRIARARAAARGIDLVVAAVIGPGSVVVFDPAEARAGELKAV